jgi:hypothetical protein
LETAEPPQADDDNDPADDPDKVGAEEGGGVWRAIRVEQVFSLFLAIYYK